MGTTSPSHHAPGDVRSPRPNASAADAKGVRLPRPVVWTIVFVVAVAVGAIGVGAALSDQPGDLPFEAAKAGIQLLAVAVLGGAVTYAYRVLDERRQERARVAAESREDKRRKEAEAREERRLLDDYRAGIARDLIEAYHAIKTVRRTLHASGFRPPASGTLSAEDREMLWRQMEALVGAQLALERVVSEVEAQPPVFEPHVAAITSMLGGAEEYVNDAITDWQQHGPGFEVGVELASAISPARNLRRFLSGVQMKAAVSRPIVEAVRLIHSLRLRVSPEELGVPAAEAGPDEP
jgi:hypothetical protein